jgi:thioredoxin 1
MVVGKCNVEDCEDIAMELGIRNIPTLIFFKNGEIVDKFVGAGNKATLQAKFEANL